MWVLTLMLSMSVVGTSTSAKERVIFDSDSAFFNDDGAALAMLLCHPRAVDVVGVTLVSGNVWLEQGAAYTLHLLDMLERPDIPVLLGEALPLSNTAAWVKIQGENWGLGYVGAFSHPRPRSRSDLHPPYGGVFSSRRPLREHAADYLIEQVRRAPGELTVFAAGPHTNLARALERDSGFAKNARRLVMMGGALEVPGNTSASAELNLWFDPEAARRVFAAEWREIVVFPLDVTNTIRLTEKRLARIARSVTPLSRILVEDLGRYPGLLKEKQEKEWSYVWDVLVAAYLIDPTLVTRSETVFLDVDTNRGPNYGALVASSAYRGAKTRPVTAVFEVDVERFFERFEKTFATPCGAALAK